MNSFEPRTLLDVPPFPADGYAKLADRLGAILGAKNDVMLVQGEAIIALEAAATSLAWSKLRALNIVTSPYGTMFGGWLRRGGAEVSDVFAPAGMPIEAEKVAEALSQGDFGLVAMVHAESATGILNPLAEIAKLAKDRDALLLVDAVASAGGHELDVDALGIDICAIGPQKSLAGPAGISMLTVSPAAWAALERNDASAGSILSLMDLKHLWLDNGRGALPGMPSALEWHALAAALDRFEAEGIDAAVARHERAAKATRAAMRTMGVSLWIDDDAQASNLVTVVKIPGWLTPEEVLKLPGAAEAGLDKAVGVPGLVRLNHTGERARRGAVEGVVRGYGEALQSNGMPCHLEAGLEAVAHEYAA